MPTWVIDLLTPSVAGVLVVLFALLVGLGVIVRKSWKPVRAFFRLVEALVGTDERDRDGRKTHPGLLDRLDALEAEQTRQGAVIAEVKATQTGQGALIEQIHHEVTPNSGGSIKDAVARIEKVQKQDVARLSDHLASTVEEIRDVVTEEEF